MTNAIYPEMITLRETAKRTGLAYDTLRKMCSAGEIVHIRSGNKILVNFTWLQEYLSCAGLSSSKVTNNQDRDCKVINENGGYIFLLSPEERERIRKKALKEFEESLEQIKKKYEEELNNLLFW